PDGAREVSGGERHGRARRDVEVHVGARARPAQVVGGPDILGRPRPIRPRGEAIDFRRGQPVDASLPLPPAGGVVAQPPRAPRHVATVAPPAPAPTGAVAGLSSVVPRRNPAWPRPPAA